MHPTENDLRDVLNSRTRLSSAGFPYLHRSSWTRLRDWVPVLFKKGLTTLALTDRLVAELGEGSVPNAKVVRQVVLTAAITAPSDLWLMRHIQSALCRAGIAERFIDGQVVHSHNTGFLSKEVEIDLRFLLSRGTLIRQGKAYRLADNVAAKAFMSLEPTTTDAHLSSTWIKALQATAVSMELRRKLQRAPLGDGSFERGIWHPTAAEVELGAQLVPLVVALRAERRIRQILEEERFQGIFVDPTLQAIATELLTDAGVLQEGQLTEIGRRVLARGPGPMGIIEAYRQYLPKLSQIWARGRGEVWVERTANVAASQTANRKSFRRAHDALDAFCSATGFSYSVFIEHAVGRGEAIRQRAQRAKKSSLELTYIGADLEDKAIDAAIVERDAGALPASTRFVRHADIGDPTTLLTGLKALDVHPKGSVMMVGNGFHEVRDRDDAQMIEVFRAYEQAGLVLIFTEESALSIDDLLETAFNTYHAGFRYVHERSGQRLRPGAAAPGTVLERDPVMSWAECAQAAGYVRADRYCKKSRTVYPYTPPSGFNPYISAEHFFVPGALAHLLKE